MQRMNVVLGSVLLAAIATAPGCMSADPIAGTWSLTRTIQVQPAGCPAITPGGIEVTIDPGGSPEIAPRNGDLFDNGQARAGGTSATFTTEEYALQWDQGPILIGHTLTVSNDTISGTAIAHGDGEALGCEYTMYVHGTRK